MRVGQVNLPLRVPISPLLVDAPTAVLSTNTTSVTQVLSFLNTAGLLANYPILIGEPGSPSSEIAYIQSVDDANQITLTALTLFPHSASTKVYLLPFDTIEISNAPTLAGAKTVIATLPVTTGITTDYNDTVSTGGYYFARFYQAFSGAVASVSVGAGGTGYAVNAILTLTEGDGTASVKVTSVSGGVITGVTILSRGSGYTVAVVTTTGGGGSSATISITSVTSYSPYSDDVPYEGYTIRSARSIIDAALGEINKQESTTLTDEFAFQQLDNVQTEVIQDLKRWSFMQKFDEIIGNAPTGSWKVALPEDIGDDNTNKSVYQLRLGTQQRLVWVSKEKFDEFLVSVAYTTLKNPAAINDTTLTLTDSSDFNSLATMSDGSGMVTIGANTYAYSANDTATGILTLVDAITADTVAAAGADVFQGATQGLPNYWTTYGGNIYTWPITASTYNGFNWYMDYYSKQLKITSDSDIVVIPDPMVAVYYLCWKFLKKLANGADSPDSQAYQAQYMDRKKTMKNKEVMNRTFKLRPKIQNFAVQTAFSESTPRWIRDANFPNTGF